MALKEFLKKFQSFTLTINSKKNEQGLFKNWSLFIYPIVLLFSLVIYSTTYNSINNKKNENEKNLENFFNSKEFVNIKNSFFEELKSPYAEFVYNIENKDTIGRILKKFRIIGIDVDIRKHNKKAIKTHEMYKNIEMHEGSSTDKNILVKIKKSIKKNDKVLVILDSNHSTNHVFNELNSYSKLVTKNSYIVACDGIQKNFNGAPRSKKDWKTNNPLTAIRKFLKINKNFIISNKNLIFNESKLDKNYVTYWPNAYLKKIR